MSKITNDILTSLAQDAL